MEGWIDVKVHSKYLLIIASVVWALAGANIARLGIQAIISGDTSIWLLVAGIPLVFMMFHLIFTRLVGKHSDRIREYGDKRMGVHRFFDAKGYIMMIIMMGGGIALRSFGLVPGWFVAFFYTGIGIALVLAGIGFLIHYLKRGNEIVCPVTKKTRLA